MRVITFATLLAVLAASAAALDPFAGARGSLGSERDPEDGPRRVESLPGFEGPLPSQHHAGYVTVAPAEGRRLWYYLVGSESPETAGDDPLLIWLTGGPGCSSLDAFTYEHGPFKFHIKRSGNGDGGRTPRSAADVTLTRNPDAWSRAAHVLYVDSPAGTGMSYSSRDKDEYITDDSQTVEDLLTLLLGIMDDLPDMRYREVYIAGESYAGVYVPLLAERILKHNNEVKLRQQRAAGDAGDAGVTGPGDASVTEAGVTRRHYLVNLVGYVVGNGVTDDEVDGNAQVPYAWGAGLLDKDTHTFVTNACEANFWNATKGSKCWEALDVMDAAIGDINPYDVGSACYFPRNKSPAATSNAAGSGAARRSLAAAAVGVQGAAASRRAWPFAARFERGAPLANWWSAGGSSGGSSGDSSGSDSSGDGSGGSGLLGHTVPCADRRAALAYWNDPEVRSAIHAAPARVAGGWQPCSDVLHYTHTAGSMIPVHRRLLAAGLRALVYSGLNDYVVPFTGSRSWTAGLQLPTALPWRPWKLGRQVAGHAVRYRAEDGGPLTYATVIGAGHMVPSGRPAAALALLKQWLAREL